MTHTPTTLKAGEAVALAKAALIDFAEEVWEAGREGYRCDSIAACREARLKAEAAIDALAAPSPAERAASVGAVSEHSPDDMTVPQPTTDLKVGDYVFGCRWCDGEPGDPWGVGWIEEINLSGGRAFVTLQGSPRGWRHAVKITEEQGHRICALYPAAEPLSHQERLAARAEAFGLAALATPQASPTPQAVAGFVLVPREPTTAMIHAADRLDWTVPHTQKPFRFWEAMLAAAQPVEVPKGSAGGEGAV